MNSRSTFWISAAALLTAALALGLVAVVRAGDEEPAAQAQIEAMDMEGMAHGAAAPQEGVPDATASRGGRPLGHTTDGDTWVFDLTTRPVEWEIVPGVRVTAWTYNGTVPGPEIRVPYEFRAIPTADSSSGGTFMYHSHFDEDRQVGLGLSASFVIEPQSKPAYDVERTIFLGEWNLDPATGATRPPMQMEGALPNYFTINGKSFPATETINVNQGDRVLLRVVGGMQFTHPMHLHGMSFDVVAKDGAPFPEPYEADVVDIAPGERYDLLFTADAPGRWVFHCHIGHHLTNNGESPGGLLTVVEVA